MRVQLARGDDDFSAALQHRGERLVTRLGQCLDLFAEHGAQYRAVGPRLVLGRSKIRDEFCGGHRLRQRDGPLGQALPRFRARPPRKIGDLEPAQHQRSSLAAGLVGEQQVVGAVPETIRRDEIQLRAGIAIERAHARPTLLRRDGGAGQRPERAHAEIGATRVFHARAKHDRGIAGAVNRELRDQVDSGRTRTPDGQGFSRTEFVIHLRDRGGAPHAFIGG